MIDPKEIIVDDKKFTISKFSAIAGREIVTKYQMAKDVNYENYLSTEEVMKKLMSYVSVKKNDVFIKLDNSDLINNHVGDWSTLLKLEEEVLKYNLVFFQNGKTQNT